MRINLKHLSIAVRWRKDLVPGLVTFTITAVAAIASVLQPNPYFTMGIFIAIIVFCGVWILLQFLPIMQLPYSMMWHRWHQARKWLRDSLSGNPPRVQESGVNVITVIGTVSTDIGELFEAIVNALVSGLHFRVIMVNPGNASLIGAINEIGKNVKKIQDDVQEPLAKNFQKWATKYERSSKKSMASQLLKWKMRLAEKDYADHAECITICEDAWILAGQEAKERQPNMRGLVETYYVDELPWARQWIFDDVILLYSAYPGDPGVDVNNPVFCYTERRQTCMRAKEYADWLVGKLGAPHKKFPA